MKTKPPRARADGDDGDDGEACRQTNAQAPCHLSPETPSLVRHESDALIRPNRNREELTAGRNGLSD